MNKRMTALLLCAALIAALGVNAATPESGAAEPPAVTETAAEPAAPAAEPDAGSETQAAADAEPAAAAAEGAEADAEAQAAEIAAADAEGTISFGNLRARMLASYYPLLALQENIRTLEEWDYKMSEEDLREKLNKIADQQWAAISIGSLGSSPELNSALSAAIASDPTNVSLQASQSALMASGAAGTATGTLAAQQLQLQYDAYNDAFDDIRSGKTQKDNAGVIRQLVNAQDQVVIVAESLYVTLKDLEMRDAALTRTIDGLRRTEQELQLRQKLGQVSELTLLQVSAGLAQAESGQKTLRMNMDNALLQLKAMTGAALDAPLALAALPQVTKEQLAAMDLEADLKAASEASYELYSAEKALEDAKKDYSDAGEKYGFESKKNEWMQAKHSWQAAKYTYENAKLSYELKFRTLFAQVKDSAQAVDAKRVSLARQEKEYAASALKYRQGSISANALAEAKDALAEAKDAVAGAERDLFSRYRSYEWAVQYGILNG